VSEVSAWPLPFVSPEISAGVSPGYVDIVIGDIEVPEWMILNADCRR
jgi:hypothetical protein